MIPLLFAHLDFVHWCNKLLGFFVELCYFFFYLHVVYLQKMALFTKRAINISPPPIQTFFKVLVQNNMKGCNFLHQPSKFVNPL